MNENDYSAITLDMWKTSIICSGKIKASPYLDLQNEYCKRILPSPHIVEIIPKNGCSDNANQKILSTLKSDLPLFVLDETGINLKSEGFTNLIEHYVNTKSQPIQFVIGPSDGVNEEIRSKADELISFGKMTWPHLLSRILLLEQIYRAQTISTGHPYHK